MFNLIYGFSAGFAININLTNPATTIATFANMRVSGVVEAFSVTHGAFNFVAFLFLVLFHYAKVLRYSERISRAVLLSVLP